MKGRRPPRKLTPEEKRLWDRATTDVAPLLGSQSIHASDPWGSGKGEGVLPSEEKPDLGPGASDHTARRRHTPQRRANTLSPHKPPSVFSAGNPRADRQVRSGRRQIEATFDLHGHTQESARAALLRFITNARGRGLRCVLVITGKGSIVRQGVVMRRSADAPTDHAQGKGVLKQRFQEWLDEPEFRGHISRAAPAHQRHGGDGAFYVYLKR